jgi:hypothetical protein
MKHATAISTRDRLVEILEGYVSRITIDSMLATVLAQRAIEHSAIDSENLVDVVGEVMIGLRLFCPADRLPDLMIDLAEFCDRETQPVHSRRSVELTNPVSSRAHVSVR